MSVLDTMTIESLELLSEWLEVRRGDELVLLDVLEADGSADVLDEHEHLLDVIEHLQMGIEHTLGRKRLMMS